MNRIDLEGRKAVVTGGAQGIGYAIAERLLESGAAVAIWDKDGEEVEAAAERLAVLGYDNVETKIADGYHGCPECGPFDAIVVTAAADHVPPPLVDQLKLGGRMVIPVGGMFATQHLTLVEKTGSGEILTRQLLPVRFVPFTRRRQ